MHFLIWSAVGLSFLGRLWVYQSNPQTLCSVLERGKVVIFEGEFDYRAPREGILQASRYRVDGKVESTNARLFLRINSGGGQLRVAVRGRCAGQLQNPGADPLTRFRPIMVRVVGEPVLIAVESDDWFQRWLLVRFAAWPGLRGWVLAAWTADERGLGPELKTSFAGLGLLHVLALSGAQIYSLGRLIELVLYLLFRLGLPTMRAKSWCLVGAAAILFCTTHGVGSVYRAALAVGVARAVKPIGWNLSSIKLTVLGILVAIAWEPSRLTDLSFLWSMTSAGVLLATVNGNLPKSVMVRTFLTSMMLWPIALYFSGQTALAAPVASATLGIIWELVVYPVGFCLPLLATSRAGFIFDALNWAWERFVGWQISLQVFSDFSLVTAPRPNWGQALMIQYLLCVFVLYIGGKLRRDEVRSI